MAATAVESYQRLRGGPASQEITYGWYPPAKNIWKNYRVKSATYDQECLFRHSKSRFKHGENGIATPVAPTPFRMHLSQRPETRSKSPTRPLGMTRCESVAAQSMRLTPKPPSATSTTSKRLAKSAGSYRKPPTMNTGSVTVPTVTQAWENVNNMAAASLEVKPPSVNRETINTVTTANAEVSKQEASAAIATKIKRVQSAPVNRSRATPVPPSPKPESVMSLQPKPVTPPKPELDVMPKPETPSSPRPARVKSAHVCRSKPETPQYRPIKSAGPSRSPVKVLYPRPFSASPVPPEDQMERPSSAAISEPVLPSQQSPMRPEQPQVTYDEQLERHGWRMQVHGDPLNLKQPAILERKPYAVTVPDSSFVQPGPKGHMQNWDTYFFNTIPRRTATFDVHQEWISEVIHAKRMELQKRDGGIKYRYKNFSFVY